MPRQGGIIDSLNQAAEWMRRYEEVVEMPKSERIADGNLINEKGVCFGLSAMVAAAAILQEEDLRAGQKKSEPLEELFYRRLKLANEISDFESLSWVKDDDQGRRTLTKERIDPKLFFPITHQRIKSCIKT